MPEQNLCLVSYPKHLYPSKDKIYHQCGECFSMIRSVGSFTKDKPLFRADKKISRMALPESSERFNRMSSNLLLCGMSKRINTKFDDVLYLANDTNSWDGEDGKGELKEDEFKYYDNLHIIAFNVSQIDNKEFTFFFYTNTGEKRRGQITCRIVHDPLMYNFYHLELISDVNFTGGIEPLRKPPNNKSEKNALHSIRNYFIEELDCIDGRTLKAPNL